ncbi:MAG: YcxB family protein [Hespellia sp.]|nr:YcxB family protein [Hespellia sp.]
MSVKFDITMTSDVMFNFMISHTYTHLSGIFGVIFGFLSLVIGINKAMGGDVMHSAVFFLFAFLFILYMPFSLWFKARNQVKKSPMFQKPISYELTEEGVTVSQDDQVAETKWEDFTKAISTNQAIVIYVTKVRAIIFPKAQLGGKYAAVVEAISTHMPPNKVKIRSVS